MEREERSGGNVGGKVVGVRFWEWKDGFGVVENEVERGCLGVNFVWLKELEFGIGCDKGIGWWVVGRREKEECERGMGKEEMKGDVVRGEFGSVVFVFFLGKKVYEWRRGKVFGLKRIVGFWIVWKFNDREIMRFDMGGGDERDNMVRGKGSVREEVGECNIFGDRCCDDGYDEVCFVVVVLVEGLVEGGMVMGVFGKGLLELGVGDGIIWFVWVLRKNRKMKDDVSGRVSEGKKERFEGKNRVVMKMGVKCWDVLNGCWGVGIVCVMKYERGSGLVMVCGECYVIGELNVEGIKKFGGVYVRISDKGIE